MGCFAIDKHLLIVGYNMITFSQKFTFHRMSEHFGETHMDDKKVRF